MMISNESIFGARASVVFQFEGTLEVLASRLAVKLNLKSFDIDTDSEPPHRAFGMAEGMGWNAWLVERANRSTHFCLMIETGHSTDETFSGRIHDLSPWFARLISMYLNVQVEPGEDGGVAQPEG